MLYLAQLMLEAMQLMLELIQLTLDLVQHVLTLTGVGESLLLHGAVLSSTFGSPRAPAGSGG